MEIDTFYNKALKDIERYSAAITETIERLLLVQGELQVLKSEVEAADITKCLFCRGIRRDLEAVINSADLFAHLGGTYSSYESYRYMGESVPERWECQECFARDSSPPSTWARRWDRNNPGKDTFAKKIFKLFPGVKEVGMDKGPIWMVKVADTWYTLPGTKETIEFRYTKTSLLSE